MTDITPAQFTAELHRVAAKIPAAAAAVVKRGAVNIKRDARATAAEGRTSPGKAQAVRRINFDVTGDGLTAEIGYDKPAGALGTMLEYGSAGNQPGNDLGRALAAEAPKAEQALAREVTKLWRRSR